VTTPSSYGIVEQASTRTDHDGHVERIRLEGFTVVPGAFTVDELTYLADRIDTLLAEQAERAGGIQALVDIGEHDTLRCCLAHDEAFVRLAANEPVLAICRQLLGDFIVLTQQNAIANPPGRVHHQAACHRDLPYQHFVSSRPLAISALFCVDPFTPENGATVVLPGTHRVEHFPSDALAKEIERPVEAPAGSFVVFDSMLFHRAGHNRSTAMRRAVNHVYALPFIGQQISMPDVLQGRYADDPALRRLFGYETKPVASVDDWWARRRARR
jgi:ectoine hydroxylase-related dioxygenase (phytanoyl-CoA dioxygenase family)